MNEAPRNVLGNQKDLLDIFIELVDGIRDHNIKRFLNFFISGSIATKFFESPAARGENPGHHSFRGGLAYHTLHAARLASTISDHYNKLGVKVNRDIVIAGVILHDIGKIDCYIWDNGSRTKQYYHDKEIEAGYIHTKIGKMFHHIPHGFQIFMKAASDFNRFFYIEGKYQLTDKKIQHLGHIILSHHGRKSWSSPVVPNTIEAYIVHLVEMGDAMIDKYNKGVDVREIYDN